MDFIITHPSYLWLLLLVPIVIGLHFMAIRARKNRALAFANFEAIARVKGVDFYSRNLLTLIIFIFVIIALVLAFSGLTISKEVTVSKFSFVIALDTSESMEAKDIEPSRLVVARTIAQDFVSALPDGSRVGVISFSGNSYIQQSLTDSKRDVYNSLNQVEISSVGGTDLYEAIITSTNLLEKEPYKVAIILSDGQTNVGNLEEALAYATRNNVVIHTIGIGTIAGGETSYGLSKLDEDSLTSIAYETRGTYYPVSNKEELNAAFNKIDTLSIATIFVPIHGQLIAFAIGLLVLLYILSGLRYTSFP